MRLATWPSTSGRDLGDERRPAGLHRYEVAQGFQPEKIDCYGRSAEDVIERASGLMGAAPSGCGCLVEWRGGVGRPPAGRSGPDDDLAARARAWVERTCAEQGVPVKVSDPQTIAKVAELLAQGRQNGVKRDSSKRL